ncbi:cupin domain-containing protein [Natronosalvus vescus]|uniref:cupin domain-containing protein n=1 Tax=Natronosalvus vescus TaxID=2953881 RepID=UPI0020915025|nr:cupin domain-containing protein [Natronosalvus vescus]
MSQMVTKSSDAQPREYSGVNFELLAVGEESMVTKMLFEVGNEVEMHSHPNEQSGYVISGRYRLIVAGEETIIEAGDSYAIPEGVEHGLEVLESGEVIDVFVPPREKYR